MSSPSTPASACSSGTVTSDSTSAAESPSVIVWTSTFGGANSGNTSTGMLRICPSPKNISPAAAAVMMNRYRRLVAMISRSMFLGPAFDPADAQWPPPTPVSAP
jgi:hypothetical protein